MLITGFRSEPSGLFLDLNHSAGSVAISRDTGDISLNPNILGDHNGDSLPSTITADKVGEIEVVPGSESQIQLKLTFRTDYGTNREISFGSTDQGAAARAWIDEVKTVVSFRARRARLNPTVDGHVRAVPSILSDASAASASQGHSGVDSVAPPSTPVNPVEIPSAKIDIDENLERELEAAMAGQMSAPAAVPTGGPATHSTVTQLPSSEDQLESGMKLKAKVQRVTTDDVFCEVGFRCPGLLPVRQFPQGKQPHIGEEFLVVVEKYDPESGVIYVNLPRATRKVKGGNWEELSVGQVVEGTVNRTNKGGLEVTIGGLRAFLPASQIELGFTPQLDAYVGKKFPVQITEVNPAKRNLIVSRRAVLIQERKEAAAAFWPTVDVGQQFSGSVKTIKDYGAFIDLGGADGFLHIGEMSWNRVKHPSEVLKEGDKVDVVVLSLDREKQKIGLGMRQLARNPWADAVERYSVGKNVQGKVTRVTEFGAFIELEQGVEGLVHISELDHQRVRRVQDVLTVAQEVQVQVLEVIPDRQRISLSLKALKEKPEPAKSEEPEPQTPPPAQRKRKEPLRGGNKSSESTRGGLFGNPDDYR